MGSAESTFLTKPSDGLQNDSFYRKICKESICYLMCYFFFTRKHDNSGFEDIKRQNFELSGGGGQECYFFFFCFFCFIVVFLLFLWTFYSSMWNSKNNELLKWFFTIKEPQKILERIFKGVKQPLQNSFLFLVERKSEEPFKKSTPLD